MTAILAIPVNNLSIRDAVWAFWGQQQKQKVVTSDLEVEKGVQIVAMNNPRDKSDVEDASYGRSNVFKPKKSIRQQQIPSKFVYGSTLIVLSSAALVSVPVKELSTMGGLAGMIGGVATMYVLPGCFFWSSSGEDRKVCNQALVCMYFVVGFVTFLACGRSLMDH